MPVPVRTPTLTRGTLICAAVQHPATYPKQGMNRKAIVAFVFTLIGVLVVPLVFSSAGIALGLLARREMSRHPAERGRGLATAALVIGPLGFALSLVVNA